MYIANRHCRWHIGRNTTFVMDAVQRDCTCDRDTLHKLNHFSNVFDKSKLYVFYDLDHDLSFARMRIEEKLVKYEMNSRTKCGSAKRIQ